MTSIRPVVTGLTPPPDPKEIARLRDTAKQMEGVFVRQMFSAMRETVSKEGVIDGGAGEDIFTSMMDEHVANAAPSEWHHGLAAQVVEQFRSRVKPEAPGAKR